MHLSCGLRLSAPGHVHAQVVPAGNYFAFINDDGNFQFGCQVFYPAIWNQCAPLSCALTHACMQHHFVTGCAMHAGSALQASPVLVGGGP